MQNNMAVGRGGGGCDYTVCPRSSGPFYVVTYYIKWVTTSWTHSTLLYYNSKKPGYVRGKKKSFKGVRGGDW